VPKPQWLFCQNTLVVRLGRRFVLDHPGCGQIADLACVAGPSTGVVLYAREPAAFRGTQPAGVRMTTDALEIVHGEIIDAARADVWASSLGQDDTRLSARTQNPRHQVGQGRVDDSTGC
jgi:hypothetical protein